MHTPTGRFAQSPKETMRRNEVRINDEITRLNTRLDELEKRLLAKVQRLQNELAADFKRLELRVDELECRNKVLQLRLEAVERQLRFELDRSQQPELGFDKIGIA